MSPSPASPLPRYPHFTHKTTTIPPPLLATPWAVGSRRLPRLRSHSTSPHLNPDSSVSPDQAVYSPGPVTSAATAKPFNDCRLSEAMGHNGLGRLDSLWCEADASFTLQHYPSFSNLRSRHPDPPPSVPPPPDPSAPTSSQSSTPQCPTTPPRQ